MTMCRGSVIPENFTNTVLGNITLGFLDMCHRCGKKIYALHFPFICFLLSTERVRPFISLPSQETLRGLWTDFFNIWNWVFLMTLVDILWFLFQRRLNNIQCVWRPAHHKNSTNWETLASRRKLSRICGLFKAYSGERAWKAIGDRLERPHSLKRVDHDRKIRSRRQRTGISEIFFCK